MGCSLTQAIQSLATSRQGQLDTSGFPSCSSGARQDGFSWADVAFLHQGLGGERGKGDFWQVKDSPTPAAASFCALPLSWARAPLDTVHLVPYAKNFFKPSGRRKVLKSLPSSVFRELSCCLPSAEYPSPQCVCVCVCMCARQEGQEGLILLSRLCCRCSVCGRSVARTEGFCQTRSKSQL